MASLIIISPLFSNYPLSFSQVIMKSELNTISGVIPSVQNLYHTTIARGLVDIAHSHYPVLNPLQVQAQPNSRDYHNAGVSNNCGEIGI